MITDHPFTVRRQDGIGPHPDDHPCAATVPNGTFGHSACNRPLREHLGQRPPEPVAPQPELWCAYNGDGSAYAIFPTEVEALRHAVGYCMSVEKIGYGDINESINAARARRMGVGQ